MQEQIKIFINNTYIDATILLDNNYIKIFNNNLNLTTPTGKPVVFFLPSLACNRTSFMIIELLMFNYIQTLEYKCKSI